MEFTSIDLLRRAVDLVNTLATPGDERAALTDLLHRHGDPGAELSPADLAELRAVATTLAAVLDTTDPDAAAPLLNRAMDSAGTRPRLSCHDGAPWHLHAAGPDAGWGASLLASSALALAFLLAQHGHCPWGRCQAPGCPRYYVHDGRGSARRFCSARCATRTRVAAHRRQFTATDRGPGQP